MGDGSSSCRDLWLSKADASVFFHHTESFAHIYCSGIVFLPAVVLPAMRTEGWSSAVHWHSRMDFEARPLSTCALWFCSVPHIINDQHSQSMAGWECWSTLGSSCPDMDPASHSPLGKEGALNVPPALQTSAPDRAQGHWPFVGDQVIPLLACQRKKESLDREGISRQLPTYLSSSALLASSRAAGWAPKGIWAALRSGTKVFFQLLLLEFKKWSALAANIGGFSYTKCKKNAEINTTVSGGGQAETPMVPSGPHTWELVKIRKVPQH